MKVFLTVFDEGLAAMRHEYWLVTPFNNIARYVERMLEWQNEVSKEDTKA